MKHSVHGPVFEGHLTNRGEDSFIRLYVGYDGDYVEGGFSVEWETVNGSATVGQDFVPVATSPNPVRFTDSSEGEQFIDIKINNDNIDEYDESFTVQLKNAESPAVLDSSRSSTSVTIMENDLHVAIFDADPVTEEDEATPWVSQMPQSRVRVTISSPRSEAVSIPWRSTVAAPPYSAEQLAFLGPDYYHPTSSVPDVHHWVTFNPGETEKFIEIGVVSDRLYELTEHFFVDIATDWLHHIQYTVDDQRATGTIIDNDPFPELAIDDVSVEESDGTATLTVTMTNRSSFPVTFDWTLANQSATRPADYDYHAASGTVTIPAGGGPDPHLEHFTFQIFDDFLTEPDETFRLTISNAVNANITKATGVVTILANDPRVDIDVDSNNNGTITGADDPIEMDAPGKVVMINRDDDNGNGIADYMDLAGPLANPDDDLEPVNLAFIQLGLPQDELNQLVVRLTYTANVIRVWDTRTKDHQIASDRWWTIAQFNQLPATLFMEGIGSGQGILTLTLHRLEGDLSTIVLPDFEATLVHFDHVVMTVTTLNLTGYTPYTEPFQLRSIAEANEENPGVHIRRNGDFDNGNNAQRDWNATNYDNENDLIRVDIDTGVSFAGLRYELERGSNDIRVWTSRNKVTELVGTNNPGPITLNSNFTTIWVEWVTPGTAEATSSLDIRLIDNVSNNVVATDTLVFHPFRSVVVAMAGEDFWPFFENTPTDPSDIGMFEVAIQLYELNYDVHMYDEDDVGNSDGSGPVWNEIRSAIQNRGVSFVSMFGHSHGGGAVHVLAERLFAERNAGQILPYSLPFTGYVDAVEKTNALPETRRHQTYQYHVNIYQPNEGVELGGGPMVNANENINTEVTAGFTRGLTHANIDDDNTVQTRIRESLLDHTER